MNPETYLFWRTGTEPCGCWAFQTPDAPGEPAGGCRGQKAEGGLAVPSLGKGSSLPETASASDYPCPPRTPAGKGKSTGLLFYYYYYFLFELEKVCLARILGLFVTWQAGGRAGDCCDHLDSLLVPAPTDLSLSKAGLCLDVPSGVTHTGVTQWGKVAGGGSGTVGVPPIPKIPPRSESPL